VFNERFQKEEKKEVPALERVSVVGKHGKKEQLFSLIH